MTQAPPRFVVGRAGQRWVIIARLRGRALVVGSACDEPAARRLVENLRTPRPARLSHPRPLGLAR